MKDSFILFTNQIEVMKRLTDEEAGKLIKAIYTYESTGTFPELEGILGAVAIQFKQTLDISDTKWEETKQKRSDAGKKGMEKRWKNDNNVITRHNKI